MAIGYFIDCQGFKISSRRVFSGWLRSVAQREGFTVGDVNLIFTTSAKLLEMNRQFLQHDYFTDIITFDDTDAEASVINGELYIDVDTVADNAQQLGVEEFVEMHRIMAHGILHLCGQGDKSPIEAQQMREKEDKALADLDLLNQELGSKIFTQNGGVRFAKCRK